MAIDVSKELQAIEEAVYGEEVRGSIHDSIEKIAEEVNVSDPLVVRRAIAPLFSNDSTVVYNVGDYVYRLDQTQPEAPSLYKCQTPTTGGTFDGSCWIKASLGEDVAKRVEVNQFRFDSATSPNILAGKSCNDLTRPGVWYVNKVDGISTLTDFPIDGPGWIRISGPNTGRLMQEVYPSDIETYSYRLFRTKDARLVDGESTTAWTDWYKVPLIPEDGHLDLKADFYYYPLEVSMFEIGTAYVSNSAIRYDTGNGDVIRIKKNQTINLNAGTTIYAGSGYEVRIIKITNNQAEQVSNFTGSPVTIASDGEYVIAFRITNGTTIPLNDSTIGNLYIVNSSKNADVIGTAKFKSDAAFDAVNLTSITADFEQGTAYYKASTNSVKLSDTATRTRQIVESPFNVAQISCESGYEAAVYVCTYDGTTYTPTWYQSAWSEVQQIPISTNGKYIFVVVRKPTDADITPAEANANVRIMSKLEAALEKNAETYRYSYYGQHIDIVPNGYNVNIRDRMPEGMPNSLQAGGVYDGILFQTYSSGNIATIDLSTNTLISTFSAATGHANSCQFSTEKYDPADAYPLLYVTEFNNNLVYVLRVTQTSATLVKTIGLTGTPGYKACASVDTLNNRLITVGVHLNDAFTESGNYTIVSMYDLSDQTETDGVYYPRLIKSFNLPFVFCIQDTKMFNNRLAVLSSADSTIIETYNQHGTWIYWIDPYNESIVNIMKDFPSAMQTSECEVLDIFEDNGKTKLLVVTYKRYSYEIELQ